MTADLSGIYSADARWDDEQALTTLFAPLPDAIVANIRQGHAQHESFSGMRHDAATSRGFYVRANATILEVWTLTPCSFDEAVHIGVALLDEAAIDVTTMMRVYTQVTGRRTEYAQ